MYHGLIIVNQEKNYHVEDKISRLLVEAKQLDIELKILKNDGTLVKIDENGQIVIELLRGYKCDFIIYLDKDYYAAKMLKEAGYTLFNDPEFLKLCDDKMLTYIALTNKGIAMPKTYAAPLIYHEDSNVSYGFLSRVMHDLGGEVVVKRVYGSLGEGVFYANETKELNKIYEGNYKYPLLFQEYIESSKGRSIRVIVIDNKIVGAIERYNDKDFRSNFGKTNSSKPIELSKEYRDFVLKIVSVLDIKYAGIDLLYGNDGPILCEINSNAFFYEFEKTTGINVAKLYLEMIIKNLEKEEK